MLLSAIRDTWAIFKEYTNEAMVFAMAFVLLYVVFLITDCLVRIIRHRKLHSIGYVLMKTCLFALFGGYMSYILAITLSGRETIESGLVKNLDPLSTIWRNGHFNIEIFENFLMFVPLGILLPCVWKYLRGFFRTFLVGFCMSVLIEISQLIFGRGYFDVDDIIFNTIGAAIGYIIFAGFYDGLLGIKRRIISDVSKKLKRKPPLGKQYDRFGVRNGFILFLLQSFPVLIWANMVMGFSSEDGDKSGELSKGLLRLLLRLLGGGQEISGPIGNETDTFLFYEAVLRKFAHMFEYGLLAFLIWAAFYSIRWISRIMAYGLALMGAFIVAIADETNQMSVFGRSGSYRDVIVDMTGSIGALAITFVIVTWASKYYVNKHSS